MPITINNHQRLQESVVRAVLAAGAAGVAGMFLPVWIAAAVMALAIGLAVGPPTSWGSAAWAILWAAAAGAGAKVGGTGGAALTSAAVGATLARGVEGPKRFVVAALGMVGALTASMVGRAFAMTEVLDFLPSGIEALVVG